MTDKILTGALTYEEAQRAFRMMTEALPADDKEFMDYYEFSVLRAAVRYADIRAGWNLKTREEKINADPARTAAHDAWIAGLKSLARNEGEAGKTWFEIIGPNDRRRIGDYACYVAAFLGIEAR